MSTQKRTDKSRREFLRELALGSSLLALSAPWLNAFASDGNEPGEKNNQVSLAVIGTGSRGTQLLSYLIRIRQSANIRIIALCDTYQPNLKQAFGLCQQNGFSPNTYADYKDMLGKENPDGVIIATPLTEHAQMTVDCLNRGVHTFCEKAMARTCDEVKRMYDTHRESGKVLQIGHQRMFNPIYLEGMKRIQEGAIGSIGQMRAYWHRNNNWRRPLPGRNPALDRQINWRLYKDLSAGVLTELMTHQLQVAMWVLNKVPESVIGTGSLVYWNDGRTIPDNASLTFSFDNGVQFIYDSMTSNRKYGLEEQILGSEGTIEFETNRIFTENIPPAPGIRQLIHDIERGIFEHIPIGGASWVPETAVKYEGDKLMPEDFYEDSQFQLEAFAGFIRQGSIPERLVREAYYTSIWTLLGETAIDEGRKVFLPDEYRIL